MFMRLRTVRAKLTALVSLSVVVMLAALPVLSWVLHRQLVDEVGNRVADAEGAFQTEIDDYIANLTLASRVLADDAATARALARGDATGALHLAETFSSVYPNIDVLIVEGDRVLAQVGVDHPPEKVDSIEELVDLAHGKSVSALVEHGCEKPTSDAPPGYLIGVPVRHHGGVRRAGLQGRRRSERRARRGTHARGTARSSTNGWRPAASLL